MSKSIFKLSLNILTILTLLLPCLSYSAEKKPKNPPVAAPPQETVIADSNISAFIKKGDEMFKKGDIESSLRIYLKVYSHSKDILAAAAIVQTQYERVLNDASASEDDKETILLKQKRLKQITPKYTSIKESMAYNLGYIYSKRGDSERARKYLTEVLETTPFSLKKDSLWMNTKNLLLGQYGLEGEF